MNSHNSGHNELLETKIKPPRVRASSVPRTALLAKLDKGVTGKLSLISAPTGAGKTSLVSAWVVRQQEQTRSRIAWVSLDTNDDDPVRFWRYVFTACRVFDDLAAEKALTSLLSTQLARFDTVIGSWINGLVKPRHQNILILDDYHNIDSPQIHDTITFLLDHLPSTLHVVIVSRTEPALMLASLRANGDLLELRDSVLRFSVEETQHFLENALPFSLPLEMMTYLHKRTEGWAVGLHLSALMLRDKSNVQEWEASISALKGSYRPITDYLVSEVLNAQPAKIQDFLLKTSVLSKLTEALCDAVLGGADSGEVLWHLEQLNLFLTPLDESGQWYSYHALFAEAMQNEALQRFGQDAVDSLYQRASNWYQEQRMFVEAVEASLSANDVDRAAFLVECLTEKGDVLEANELHNLRRWLQRLPEELIYARPTLCFLYARVLLFTRDPHALQMPPQIEPLLQVAEQTWKSQDDTTKLGEILAFRAVKAVFSGDYAQAAVSAREALSILPDNPSPWHGIILNTLGMNEMMAGRLNAAHQTFSRSLRICETIGNPHALRPTTIMLSQVYVAQGKLHHAAERFQQMLASAKQDKDESDQARVLIGLADLSYEWNKLNNAKQQAETAWQIAARLGDEQVRVLSALWMARVMQARSEYTHAQQTVTSILARIPIHREPALYREALASQAQLHLTVRSFGAVEEWINRRNDYRVALNTALAEQELQLIARLRIEQGRSDEALTILSELCTDAQQAGRVRSVIESRVIEVLAHDAQHKVDTAQEILYGILSLACREGYQRLFLDKGNSIRMLLQQLLPEVRDNALLKSYLNTLLLAFDQQNLESNDSYQPAPVNLDELLTPQEEKILGFFARGYTKNEIAGKLSISINTVKTHLRRVYQKLGINQRSEARQIAHRLNLIS